MDPDRERTALYAAETAAFDGTDLERRVSWQVIAHRCQMVTLGEWWPGPIVEIRKARSGARSSSTKCAAQNGRLSVTVIRFSDEQMTVATAAHELAHALAGPQAGHGRLFRVAYLDVISVITNLDSTDRRRDLHSCQLRQAFSDAGLAAGNRRWPVPREGDVGPVRL